jgi:non-ribosomal peptide synthetase component F
LDVLVKEFRHLYESYCQGRPSNLPELPIQYADFAHWQRGWLSGETLAAQETYWRNALAGMHPLEIPTDHERPESSDHGASRIPINLSRQLTGKLQDLSRREGVTLFMTLMAGFQFLLGWYADETDVAVGTDIANRNRAETERLVGFFINQLVLRTDLSAAATFSELLQSVRRVSLDAYAHQDLPFDSVVEMLVPERTLERSPLVEVKFVLLNTHQAHNQARRTESRDRGLGEEFSLLTRAKFDFLMTLFESEGELQGDVQCRSSLYELVTIQTLIARFEEILTAVSDEPGIDLDSLRARLDRSQQAVFRAAVGRGLDRIDRRISN